MNRHRIDLLDSFRFLAVMSVLLYHFTYRWKSEIPGRNYYGDLFRYGFLGVQLFFVISGFVISYTLENTASLASFFKNRLIRLFPPLLLCTLITFVAAAFLDDKALFVFARQPANLLPSLTLITPRIWFLLTHKDFMWVNGSYWSLWVEVQFYTIASTLYFSSKSNFLRNMLLTTIVLSSIKYMPGLLAAILPGATPFFSAWGQGNAIFNIVFYIPGCNISQVGTDRIIRVDNV